MMEDARGDRWGFHTLGHGTIGRPGHRKFVGPDSQHHHKGPNKPFEHHHHHMTAANNDTRVVHQATRECIKFCNLARIEADQIRKEQKLLKVFTTKCFSSFYLLFWCDLNLSKIYKIRST